MQRNTLTEGRNFMKKTADILYLLATFSHRTGFLLKSAIYAGAGHKLFPEDIRLLEMHAYCLLLGGKPDEAETVLLSTDATSENLEFLRSRAALVLELPQADIQLRLRKYLSA